MPVFAILQSAPGSMIVSGTVLNTISAFSKAFPCCSISSNRFAVKQALPCAFYFWPVPLHTAYVFSTFCKARLQCVRCRPPHILFGTWMLCSAPGQDQWPLLRYNMRFQLQVFRSATTEPNIVPYPGSPLSNAVWPRRKTNGCAGQASKAPHGRSHRSAVLPASLEAADTRFCEICCKIAWVFSLRVSEKYSTEKPRSLKISSTILFLWSPQNQKIWFHLSSPNDNIVCAFFILHLPMKKRHP